MPILAAVLGLILSEAGRHGSIFELIDFGAAFLGGVIVGAALGAWLLPVVIDRLHRGK